MIKDFSKRGLNTQNYPLDTSLCIDSIILNKHTILCILCINNVYEYGVYFVCNFSWEDISKRSTYLCTWTEQEYSTHP